ncbi:MAG: TolC family protein [Planctomycetota bacterium]
MEKTKRRRGWWQLLVIAPMVFHIGGCSRKHYRTQADCDVTQIYHEKRAEEAWTLPPLPGVEADPRSRFYDPSPRDCPALPVPEPALNDYVLPPLMTGEPSVGIDTGADEPENDVGDQYAIEIPARTNEGVDVVDSIDQDNASGQDPNSGESTLGIEYPVSLSISPFLGATPDTNSNLEAKRLENASVLRTHDVLQVSATDDPASGLQLTSPTSDSFPELIQRSASNAVGSETDGSSAGAAIFRTLTDQFTSAPDDEDPEPVPSDSDDDSSRGLRIVPIPGEFWSRIPATCLPRMLEFESVREEYYRSFPGEGASGIRERVSDAPRLTLANVMELTYLNSRDYQTRKERLYVTALRLTQERYQFWLRPTRFGNGTGGNFLHRHINGVGSDRWGFPSSISIQKTTATAGQFLATFANDVVLTSNGTGGFNSSVSTSLLLDFQQSLLQRDIVFEDLTQAERDVVYAARDLIRFQRQLFVDLADRYYQLLLTYRAIEISSQDYFSNLRAFLQGRAEYLQAGRIPRIQVDQFEQNALRSQSGLVGDCNRLESSLDSLKLDIGLPPEMPLNVSLVELDALTTSDELTVTRQLVQRTKENLVNSIDAPRSAREEVVNAAAVLIDRLNDTLRVRRRIAGSDEEVAAIQPVVRVVEELDQRLALIEARLQADLLAKARSRELRASVPPPPLSRFARTNDLIEARLLQAEYATRLRRIASEHTGRDSEPGDDPEDGIDELDEDSELELPSDSTINDWAAQASEEIASARDRLEGLLAKWETAIRDRHLNLLPELADEAVPLLEMVTALAERAVGDLLPKQQNELDDLIFQSVAETVDLVDVVADADVGGLDRVDLDADETMLTALTQRLDLMNQRGDVADARRQIKLTADALRSIIDVRVRHRLANDTSKFGGSSFSFDEAETRLSLGLDTPLNRRVERNNYRIALINYNAARRQLIDRQDDIKFSIRESLRQLQLRRNQYEIAVASAALAYERVVSTRLQLQLAVGNVVARDFLEAQQAYTAALNAVAREHISFIRGRIELFLESESIRLDPNGYWRGIEQESLDLPLRPPFLEVNPNPYGRLVPRLHYSDEIRCMH